MKAMVFAALMLMISSASMAATLSSSIPIKGGVLDVVLAKYDPFPAEAGDLVTVWFDVRNIGIEEAENAVFVLMPEYPFSLPNNDPERVYGRITGLDDIRLEYKLLVDKDAANGTYDLKIKYSNEGRIFTEETFLVTASKSRDSADLRALFVRTEPLPYPGSLSRLTVDIVNADSGTAYYTLVKASSDAASIGRDSIFVGTLEGNDFDSVDFDMKIKNVEPGTYPVEISMIYKDKDSNEISNNGTVYLRVGSTEEFAAVSKAEAPVWMYIIYIFVFVVVIRLLVPFFRWLVKPLRKK